jgi:hypothetical protein
MKKRLLSSLLLGALLVSSTSVFVSCKDYDDDISNLQQQIDVVNKTVEQINTQVTAGAVVSDVKTTANGITIYLSNGQSYPINHGTNGKDGKDGVNGTNGINGSDGTPGTVWTIGDDGYWYVDKGDGKGSVKTNYYALGKDGTNGKDGKDGANGKDGKDGVNGQDGKDGVNGTNGKDGIYYEPGTDGYWYTVDTNVTPAVKTKTNIKWQTEGVTAIENREDGVIIVDVTSTVPDAARKAEAADEPVLAYIMLGNDLRGLVFEKDQDGRLYTDGIPTIRVNTLYYKVQNLQSKDSQNEKTTDKSTTDSRISPTVYAYYHVNPANCNVKNLQDLSFVVKANADYNVTRSNAVNFQAKATFDEFKNGILKVKVDITGEPATAEKISVIALQAKKNVKGQATVGDKTYTLNENEVVTSDYATVVANPIGQLFIANKKLFEQRTPEEYHFRRAEITDGISGLDDGDKTGATVKNKKVWNTGNYDDDADIELKYKNDTIDLDDYVQVHIENDAAKKCTVANLDNLDGMTLKYEVVKNYKIGTNLTDQADFITLSTGKDSEGNEKDHASLISARVFNDGQGEAAIGRTPIIRATLMHNDEIVKVAYIKVLITRDGEIIIDDEITVTLTPGFNVFKCGQDGKAKTTVEQVNVGLYNHLTLSRDEFHNNYTLEGQTSDPTLDGYVATGDVGKVKEIKENVGGLTTYLYEWTLTNSEIWTNRGKTISNVIRYTNAAGKHVDIKLVADVTSIKDKYNVAAAEYMDAYWNADKTIAFFNVNVPKSTSDTDANNCQYENDLNSPFETYPTTSTALQGILKLKEDNATNPAVTKILYKFHSSNNGSKTFTDPKNSDNKVTKTLSVSSDGLKLMVGTEVIASIDNDAWNSGASYTNAAPTLGRHIIKYNKASETAKQLLNTNAFTVNIMARGYICDEIAKEVTITFQGKDYYTAQYVRPITIGDKAADNFIDAVDLGEKGSYINIKDLISPVDWRDRELRLYKYNNYWSYYGPFTVTFDRADAECDFQTKGTYKPIPATLDLQLDATPNKYGSDAPYGYVTYHNNGTKLQDDRTIRMKVTVEYGWGKIKTPWIYVTVAETDKAPSSARVK